MRVFFKKMGIENIRFKPAYNPYTEVLSLFRKIFTEPKLYVLSRHLKFSPSTRSSRNGLRLGTVECSGRKCWSLWASLRTSTSTAGVLAWSGLQ